MTTVAQTGVDDRATPGPRLLLGAPIAADIRAAVRADVATFAAETGRAPIFSCIQN